VISGRERKKQALIRIHAFAFTYSRYNIEKKETNLHLQQRESFDEILDQDYRKYNDIFVNNFLFVDMDVHRYFDVNQDHIQYEIFLVQFLF
jgi:hypothetical protein